MVNSSTIRAPLHARLLFCCIGAIVVAGVALAADDAEVRPPWAGPVCDRAWNYQGELPLRSVPHSVWEGLSSDSVSGALPPGLVSVLDTALDSLLALTGAPAIGVAVGIPGEALRPLVQTSLSGRPLRSALLGTVRYKPQRRCAVCYLAYPIVTTLSASPRPSSGKFALIVSDT